MKKVIRTMLIILALFVACVIFFSIRLNKKEQTVHVVAQETDPTLPIVSMEVNGNEVNKMFGVWEELGEQQLRDSITPLPNDKNLTVLINTEGRNVERVSYQITEPQDGTLIENGDITDLTTKDSRITGNFTVKTSIRKGQEYTLRFALDLGDKNTVYYYTRLAQGQGVDLSSYLVFAQKFAETCVNKVEAEKLAMYVEPDDTAANRSFTNVNIHSSMDLISWGNLSPTIVKKATPIIYEVNDKTASICLEYMISAVDSSKNTEYYLVRDFYRMRYGATGSDVTLLNFDRNAVLIYNGSLENVQTSTGLDLGVQNRDVKMLANDDNDIVAIALNGDLWEYNSYEGTSAKIFSFRRMSEDGPDLDERTQFTPHDITIESVSENGDIIFIVYGYMASGTHEGHMGISVCKYTVASNTVQERMFIPLEQGYDCLSNNVSKLSYASEDDKLYVFLEGELVRIDMTHGAYDVVADGIDTNGFVSSESQQTVAWVNGPNDGTANSATIMNLVTGKTARIETTPGEYIVGCGFLNEDFVYGLVRNGDILSDGMGGTVTGMYKICIESMDGEIKKEYNPDGVYVTDVNQESGGLELILSTRGDASYTVSGNDHIMSNEQKNSGVALTPTVFERTNEKMILSFPGSSAAPKLTTFDANVFFTEDSSETILEWPALPENGYYVYGSGKLYGVYSASNTAIQKAEELAGFVLNDKQQYVWIRGDWGTQYTIDTEKLPEGVLNASPDMAALQQTLGENYTVLNLTGVTQEDLFYLLDKGYPVIAKVSDDAHYLILGYDQYNIWVYDSESLDKIRAIATDDSSVAFEAAGNVFVSYMAK